MVKVDPQFNTHNSSGAKAEPNNGQSKNYQYSSETNRNQAEELAGKTSNNQSKLFKYGAIGAGISVLLFALKRKLLALVAAAATGFFVYKDINKAESPIPSPQHANQSQHKRRTEIDPEMKQELSKKLDALNQYTTSKKEKIDPKTYKLLEQIISELGKQTQSLKDLRDINKYNDLLDQLNFKTHADLYKKDIAKLFHPDRISKSVLAEDKEISEMIFKAAQAWKPKDESH